MTNADTKSYKKELSGVALRMSACIVIIFEVQMIAQELLMLFSLKWTHNLSWVQNTNILLAVTMVSEYAIGYPCAFLIMRDGIEKCKVEKHKMKLSHLFVSFPMCYMLLIAGSIVGAIVIFVIGILKGEPVNNSLNDVIGNANIWLTFIFAVLLAPIFEEILFRKLLCNRLVKYGQGTAILLSGLLFGLFHGNFNQFFYASFIGCFLAFIYVKTGSVKYTIALHMMINFMGGVFGSLLLQNIDLDNLTPAALIITSLYSLVIYSLVISGLVLFLINRSKFRADVGEIVLVKGQRYKIALINAGMILYCILCVTLMVFQAILD